MSIKKIKQCTLIVLLGLAASQSFAAETQFCVINNVGRDVILSAKIETINPESNFVEHIGIINHIESVPGISSSMHPNEKLNKGCIVFETMGGGHNFLSQGNPDITTPSKQMELKYTISAPMLGQDAVCSSVYPLDWRWPDTSIANVSVQNGKLICEVAINPAE